MSFGYTPVKQRQFKVEELRPSRELAERLAEALRVSTAERPARARLTRDQAQANEAGYQRRHKGREASRCAAWAPLRSVLCSLKRRTMP